MKQVAKICFSVLSLSFVLSSVAMATNEGGYAGLGLGLSNQDYLEQIDFNHPSNGYTKSESGLGGRIFAGYNFNQYIGLEAGFASYADSTYQANYFLASAKLTSKLSALDVVLKGYLPVADTGFDLYALAGGAVVYNKKEVSAWSRIASEKDSYLTAMVRPKFGLGVSYSLPSTPVVASVEASRVFGSGNPNHDDDAIPNANMISFNLAYSFNY